MRLGTARASLGFVLPRVFQSHRTARVAPLSRNLVAPVVSRPQKPSDPPAHAPHPETSESPSRSV